MTDFEAKSSETGTTSEAKNSTMPASTASIASTASTSGRDDLATAAPPCCPVSTSRCSLSHSSSSCPSYASAFSSALLRVSLPQLLMLSALLPLTARADDGWRTGRATFYGYDGGASIHQGSCMYGGLPNGLVSTGTNIAALSDSDDDFAGSCGRCYEVQCNPSSFSDGYGNYLDRSGGCYGGQPSVIVTITDSCPCNYPANAYSNRRWCCGDMYHMDLSQQAFSQLSNTGNGVMGIKFRRVECPGGFKPSPRAATWDFPAGTGR